jgi:hypothetical protein
LRKCVASKGCCVGVSSNESQRLSAWACTRPGRHRFQAFACNCRPLPSSAGGLENSKRTGHNCFQQRPGITVEASANDLGLMISWCRRSAQLWHWSGCFTSSRQNITIRFHPRTGNSKARRQPNTPARARARAIATSLLPARAKYWLCGPVLVWPGTRATERSGAHEVGNGARPRLG